MRNQAHTMFTMSSFIIPNYWIQTPSYKICFCWSYILLSLFLDNMCPIYGIHPIQIFDYITLSTLHLFFKLFGILIYFEHGSSILQPFKFLQFKAIKHHMVWPCGHINDMEEYSIVLRNVHMCHQNMLKEYFFDVYRIY
jgi:hypothetical protein